MLIGRHRCPRCFSSRLYLSRRKSDREKAFAAFCLRPLRCRECNHRFWKFVLAQSRAHRLTSGPSLNPVLAVFGAAMVGFALLISEFPTIAMCGFAGSAAGVINELYARRWRA
jgi:hypothetical protein